MSKKTIIIILLALVAITGQPYMTASLMQTMMSYQRNQQKPEALREDMFHQIRNLAQPLVMVVPMLYAGMLLGGVPAFA